MKSIEKNHLPANPRRGDFCIFFVLFCKKVRKKLLGYGFIVSRLIFLLLLKTIIEQSGTPVHTKLKGGRNPSPAKIPAGASPRPTKEVKSAWQNDIILFIMYCLLLLKTTIGQPRTSVPTKLKGGRNPSPAKISAGAVPGCNYKLLPALAIDSPPGCQCGYAAASRPLTL